MARKDVNLVIRAQDQASNALKRVNAALDEFRVAQSEVGADSGKVSKSLSNLTAALSKVESAIGGLDAAAATSGRIRDVAAALERLKAESSETAANLSQTRTEIRNTNRSLKGYEQTLTNLEKKLSQTKERQREAAAAQKEATAAATRAQASLDRLVARQADLPNKIQAQSAALDKARERWQRLKEQMDSGSPSATVQKNFESSTRNIAKQAVALKELETEYREIGSSIKVAQGEVKKFQTASARAERDISKQGTALERIGQKYTELKEKIAKAQTALRGLTNARSQGERGLAGIAQDIERAQTALAELEVFAKDADAALNSLRAEGVSSLEKQLVDQGVAADRARQNYRQLRDEAAQLAGEIGRLGVPTREQSKRFAELKQAANQAELEFLVQQEAVQKMGAAYRDGSTDIESLRSALAKFDSIQEQTSASMTELAQDGFKARQAIRALHTEMERGTVGRMATDLRRVGDEAARATPKVSRLRQVYNDLYGGSRQALSINQRLRGEVLSLIATYGGFYGVIRLLGGVVNAYQEIEAAQARLNVANNGNIQQTASDLDYLRRTADRLGVNLGTLSREYSKFQIAAQGTNLEGNPARRIFEAVTEAARVSRTSTQELAGVFTALTQIVSKGAVQMEELRQQLGDRLPGAIQLMADGLGVSTGEMIKLMEQGKVTSDALVGFAGQLEKRFGKGLPEALTSTSAELGRLQNAVFQAMLAFGESGFLESFNGLIRDLVDLLKSAEFRSFSERMSAAFSVLLDTIAIVVRNVQTFGIILGAAIGLKSIRVVNSLRLAFDDFGKSLTRNIAAYQRWNRVQAVNAATMATQVGLVGRLSTSIRGLTILVRGFLASTGVGLALVAIGTVVGGWLTSATKLNEALETHRDILDRVKNAYDAVGGSVEDWRKELSDLTAVEARENLARITEALEDARDDIAEALTMEGGTFTTMLFGVNLRGDASAEYQQAVNRVIEELDAGVLPADKLRKALDDLAEEYRDGSFANAEYARQLDASAKKYEQVFEALKQAGLIVEAVTNENGEAEEALSELGDAAEDTAREFEPIRDNADDAAEALQKFEETTTKLTDGLRGLLSRNDRLEEFFETVEDQEAFEKLARDVQEAVLEILDLQSAWRSLQETMDGTSFLGLFTDLLTDLDSVQSRLNNIGTTLGDLVGRFGALGTAVDDALGGAGNFFNVVMGNFSAQNATALEDAVNRILYRESAGDPNARASTSTATGLGQFIESTWLRLFQQNFPERAASMTRQQILQLRLDPELSYQMTTIAVKAYADALERSGAPVNNTSLYLSHFLGPSEAIRMLKTNGSTPFSQFSPSAAASNPAFANKTVQEVISYFSQALRNVTPEQLARVQQFNTNPQGDAAPDAEPWEERLDAQREFLDDQEFEIRQQKLIAQGLERQAAIEAAIREARADNPYAGEEFYRRAGEAAAELYDIEQQRRRAEEEAAAREATEQTLSDAEFEVRQQQLINDGLERQAAIEAALRQARQADPNISKEELDLLAARTAALYDLQIAQSGETEELKKAEAAQERVNQLMAERAALEERLELLRDNGQFEAAVEAQNQIDALNERLLEAIENAKELWRAVGTGEARVAIAELENAALAASDFAEQGFWAQINWTGVKDLIVGGLTNAFDRFSQAVANGASIGEAARDAFLQFAADFLREIARMILQQAILNALKRFAGTPFGTAIGVGTAHTGGVIGQSGAGSGGNLRRQISPSVFAVAPRFHSGGIVGLRPGEVPIIAQQGEEMLERDDPRHSLNGGRNAGGSGNGRGLTIINAVSGADMLNAGLSESDGQDAIFNFFRTKRTEIKQILG